MKLLLFEIRAMPARTSRFCSSGPREESVAYGYAVGPTAQQALEEFKRSHRSCRPERDASGNPRYPELSYEIVCIDAPVFVW